MKKAGVVLIGCLLLVAGLWTGDVFDQTNATLAQTNSSPENGTLVIHSGYYDVRWQGGVVKVWAHEDFTVPVRFVRYLDEQGQEKYTGLMPR